MKILVFADTHGNKAAIERLVKKADGVDLIICGGDISNWGVNVEKLLSEFKKLGKLLLIIHGNHEGLDSLIKISKKFDFVRVIHKKLFKLGNYAFFGYGGGGFSLEDKYLDELIPKIKKDLKRNEKLIFITHAPPSDTKLDYLDWVGHVGCNSRRRFIEILKPEICICGHLHENFKKRDKIKDTLLINPGDDGVILRI